MQFCQLLVSVMLTYTSSVKCLDLLSKMKTILDGSALSSLHLWMCYSPQSKAILQDWSSLQTPGICAWDICLQSMYFKWLLKCNSLTFVHLCTYHLQAGWLALIFVWAREHQSSHHVPPRANCTHVDWMTEDLRSEGVQYKPTSNTVLADSFQLDLVRLIRSLRW